MSNLSQFPPVDQRLPLYQRLREQIARQISNGVWGPGEAIPSEAELAEAQDVAVGTVRRAIQALVEDGLVEKVQGKGTFVRRPNFQSSFLRFLRFHGPGGRHEVPESRVLFRGALAAPPEVAGKLELPSTTEVIRLDRVRLFDGRPVLSEEIWLPKARFEALLALEASDFDPLLYPMYERICGEIVAFAKETLTVEAADAGQAQLLELATGTPIVTIERFAFGYNRKPLEWRRSWAPGATFRYEVEIR